MPTEDRFDHAYRVLARSLLARAPGFDRCPDATLEGMMIAGSLERIPRGACLLRRGQRAEWLFMVVEGVFEANMVVADGRRHLLTFVLPGTFMGFLSCIDMGSQPHDAVAHSPSIVLKFPVEAVSRMRLVDASLHVAFEYQLAARTRLLYDALAESLLYSLRERLARQLIELVDAFGVSRDGKWTIGLQLPQADLADLLGAGRQSINVELRKLQAEGVLKIARNHIEVLDLAGLQARAPTGMRPSPLYRPHVGSDV